MTATMPKISCAKCGAFAPSLGSGVRFVFGLKQKVCEPCKKGIDKSKTNTQSERHVPS
jgi:hypothetical protein